MLAAQQPLFHSQFNSLFLVNIILDGYGSVNSLMNYTLVIRSTNESESKREKNILLLWFEDYIRFYYLVVHNFYWRRQTKRVWHNAICLCSVVVSYLTEWFFGWRITGTILSPGDKKSNLLLVWHSLEIYATCSIDSVEASNLKLVLPFYTLSIIVWPSNLLLFSV